MADNSNSQSNIPEFLNVFITNESYFFEPVYSVEQEFCPHVEISRPDGVIRINGMHGVL